MCVCSRAARWQCCRDGCRLLGRSVGRLVGRLTSQVHSAAEPHQAGGVFRGGGFCCRCTVTSAALRGRAGGGFVFTSCCSAVSLPLRSCPRPGPCGSRVWGSESCGCSGSRPLWPEPSRDPPACSGNWNHPNQRRVGAGAGGAGQNVQLEQQHHVRGRRTSSSVIRNFTPRKTSLWTIFTPELRVCQVRDQSKFKTIAKSIHIHLNSEISTVVAECTEIVQNQCL